MARNEALRQERLKRGWSQADVARRIGSDPKTVGRWERGATVPGPYLCQRLCELYGQTADELGLRPAQRTTAPESTAAAMRTLPRDASGFTGRERELRQLLAVVLGAARTGAAPAIVTVDGMAGVGKTAFAVHAAHLLASRHPDGQIFLHLHAHTEGQRPVSPADALSNLLLTIGVPAQAVPAGLERRAAMWRDRLCDRRMLILLDDADGHEQVRSLLPAAPGCLVLITSRRRLSALEGAEPLSLAALPPVEAAELFARLAGIDADDVHRQAVAELTALCGHLPLAIGLLAGRLRGHPAWTVRYLVDMLSRSRDRLAEIQADDVAISSAFELSYQSLPEDQRRLFRHLGQHPGGHFDAHAAAALDGAGVAPTRRRLEALYNDHLVDEPAPARYQFHDLIRAYARALTPPGAHDDGAVDRLLDYYSAATSAANRRLGLRDVLSRDSTLCRPPELPEFATRREATDWLDVERPNLVDGVDCAARQQRHDHVVHLAYAVHSYLRVAGHWEQALGVHQAAVRAAQVTGNGLWLGEALNDLGVVQLLRGDYQAAAVSLARAIGLYRDLDDRARLARALADHGRGRIFAREYQAATDHLLAALDIYRGRGDRHGEANALNYLGVSWYLTDEYASAIASLHEALTLYQELGSRNGRANALNNLGVVQRLRGEYSAARASLSEALAIYRALEHRFGQADVLCNLGIVQRLTGDHLTAATSLTAALTAFGDLGNRHGEANALCNLGVVRGLTGEPSAGMTALAEALTIYRDLGDRLGQASVLGQVGVLQRAAGDRRSACAQLTEALRIYDDAGSRLGRAQSLNDRGACLCDAGDGNGALTDHRQALSVARAIGSPFEEARALEGIGRCLLHARDVEMAATHLREAGAIYHRLGVPDAGRIATTLSQT
jgi:tetratricopeptide (TPR) repeat protein/transcriptional regulator with XRE-family HTH domain